MSDPALLAAFDAQYPQAEGHKPPDGLDLAHFARTGHRVGDTEAHRQFMERAPRKPVPPAPPIPPGVRDPSEPEERQPDRVQAALDLFAGRPPAPAPRSVFNCATHGQSLATAAGGCPLCESAEPAPAGEILPGFEDLGPETDPLHPLHDSVVDFGKPHGVSSPVNPPDGPAAAQGPKQHAKEKPMTEAQTDLPTAPAPRQVPGDPFQAAEEIPMRLKLFLYGPWGGGKTTMSLKFPGVALIDMERGADHYAKDFKFKRLPVNSLKEINAAVRWLLTSDHEYRTLVLDPLTIYWDALQTKWADYFGRVKSRGNQEAAEIYTFEPKDYKPMKDEFKEFLRLLGALDMNVICTAHEADKYSEAKFMEKEGKRPDCEKSAPHFFDTVGRIYVDGSGRRMIRLDKDRTNRFKVGQDFPAEYSVFEQLLGSDDLTKKAQVKELPAPVVEDDPRPVQAPRTAPAPAGGNGGGNGGGVYPATDAQIGLLRRLVSEKTTFTSLEDFMASRGVNAPLMKRDASPLIDELRAMGGAK